MIKRIIINKKIIFIIIVLILIGYYIYYKNSNNYEEFQVNSELEENLDFENETKEKGSKQSEEQDKTNNEEKTEEKMEEKELILVHITGQIKSPGVVELEKGARVIDAINKTGGVTENADTEKINLAYELKDGTKIYIPNKDPKEEKDINMKEYITEGTGDNVIIGEGNMEKTNNLLVNINKATQTELETLPGIGPSTALKIISYRQENGKFSNIEDIKNVSGIGDNKFEKIKELICI